MAKKSYSQYNPHPNDLTNVRLWQSGDSVRDSSDPYAPSKCKPSDASAGRVRTGAKVAPFGYHFVDDTPLSTRKGK